MAYKLEEEWNSLFLGALYRATTLESTKDRFCDMTKEQIASFGIECYEFAEFFETRGPGSVGSDLDAGLRKMEVRGSERLCFLISSESPLAIILQFTFFLIRSTEN